MKIETGDEFHSQKRSSMNDFALAGPLSGKDQIGHGFQGNPSVTDRDHSNSVAKGEIRAENQSQISKSKGGVDFDQESISQPKNVMEVQKKLINRGKTNTMNPIAMHN